MATRGTSATIAGEGEKVKHGGAAAITTLGFLEEIIQSVIKVSNLVADIATASAEQAQGISQVTQGLAKSTP